MLRTASGALGLRRRRACARAGPPRCARARDRGRAGPSGAGVVPSSSHGDGPSGVRGPARAPSVSRCPCSGARRGRPDRQTPLANGTVGHPSGVLQRHRAAYPCPVRIRRVRRRPCSCSPLRSRSLSFADDPYGRPVRSSPGRRSGFPDGPVPVQGEGRRPRRGAPRAREAHGRLPGMLTTASLVFRGKKRYFPVPAFSPVKGRRSSVLPPDCRNNRGGRCGVRCSPRFFTSVYALFRLFLRTGRGPVREDPDHPVLSVRDRPRRRRGRSRLPRPPPGGAGPARLPHRVPAGGAVTGGGAATPARPTRSSRPARTGPSIPARRGCGPPRPRPGPGRRRGGPSPRGPRPRGRSS